MSATIHQLPGTNRVDPGRLDALHNHTADINSLAGELGTGDEWVWSAFCHLKAQSSGRTGGSVEVSVAALHLLLNHAERIEDRLAAYEPGGSS